MSDLPMRQDLFVQEYLKDFNATQAAIRSGYSEKTAYSQGQRLLKKVEVKERIDNYVKENILNTNEILRENIEYLKRTRDTAPPEKGGVKAAELLGKSIGQFSDNVVLSSDPNAPLIPETIRIVFEGTDDAEST